LSQEQKEKWKPIAFLSRTMQPAERNYEIYDKKLLTIIEALTKWMQWNYSKSGQTTKTSNTLENLTS